MEIIHEIDGISYREYDLVYPVEEDTLYFLSKVAPHFENRTGNVLDMGTGTGLITLLAGSRGWEVLSVDREPRALMNLRENLRMNGLRSRLILSDLFGGIPRGFQDHFDIITFNPPYLTDAGVGLSGRERLAIIGGTEGWEVMKKFLSGSRSFLKKGGSLLLLLSASWNINDLIGNAPLEIVEIDEKDIQGEKFTAVELSRI
ncbi:MAG: methyltransferase [Thermoplasmatota archaeon]